MIFVTVGTQGPFDRLVRTVDDWAGRSGRQDIFAQIGPSEFRPRHIRAQPFIDATVFRQSVEEAFVVIAHAGMGSILTALEFGKKVIVMPRRCDLGEQRNDHQLATARRLAERGLVIAASDVDDLRHKLDRLHVPERTDPISRQASPQLVATLKAFVENGTKPAYRAVP